MKDVLLITPPFTQLNTPYPATSYLKGFLNTKNISSYQIDLGIEVILELFSKDRFSEIFLLAETNGSIQSENADRIYSLRADYLATIEPAIRFLHGKQPTLARQICTRGFFPEAGRFEQIDDLEWAFGSMGMQDKAKHLATLFLEDLSDFIIECIDPEFGFSRYAERLGFSANNFDELYAHLQQEPSFIDEMSLDILISKIDAIQPKLICFSVPFPGNLYSAFRCAATIKEAYPEIKIAMGGGFPNTELRSVSDPRVFDFFDYITLDDGELPVEQLVLSLSEKDTRFKRTFFRKNSIVEYDNSCTKPDYKQAQVGTPDYSDLLLDSYISVIEVANPMHSLWSDGRWNKLTMAHGCYWGKCTFCDISLDYIKIYEPVAAALLVDRMEELVAQTGENGFHFVDEAAPPALMRAVSIEIIRRKLVVTWWTNIRFEKSFTSDLVVLLKKSGCIGVSGGLEVASDRLLKLIDKGVSVEQVARVTRNFTDVGIMVHSYLMYGYPTQTIQETIDSLEMVRQLFELGVIQSGFWHQFALTAHSPIGLNPEAYGIVPELNEISFANNDIQFKDKTKIDHSKFSYGLKKSLFNFMHGIGFDLPLSEWFDFKVPRTKIPANYVEMCLENEPIEFMKPTAKPIWLGGVPETSSFTKSKRGNTWEQLRMTIHTKTDCIEVTLPKEEGTWFTEQLEKLSIESKSRPTISALKKDFETQFEDFELFWYSNPVLHLRDSGLLVSAS
ncbi:MAG: radical SAM protein [Crocinitomicaceae bacterium]|nr:radical SAM protein [Flavobacteriales bacterium]NQZ35927.1 radical SAM protein [Crocinitomicaceae bacterium]